MQHLIRQHNLPVTATDAVDGVSSMTVVELQLGSKDPQADITETVKKLPNGNFIYTTVKWAEFPVARRYYPWGIPGEVPFL